MKTCDLSTGLGLLAHAFTKLKDRWAEAKLHWHDEAGRQFEETHLQPLPNEFQRLLVAASQLRDVLAQAERELGDEPSEQ